MGLRLSSLKNGAVVKKSIVTASLIIIVLIIAIVVVSKDHNGSKSKTSTVVAQATFTVPKGWRTYTNSNLGLSFGYPPSWNVTAASNNTGCNGSYSININAPLSEINASGYMATGSTFEKYYVNLYKYSPKALTCNPNGTYFNNLPFNYLKSAASLSGGVFKNDWLTLIGPESTNSTSKYPDAAFLSQANYSGKSNKFKGSAIVKEVGNTYQVWIYTGAYMNAQLPYPVPLLPSEVQSTQLYSDTIQILNSLH